ncbi:HNH endonuclease [Haloarchaeobius sp. DYHT-AS-18]|uniref:HNH endonuclease n=1 Tax=Haloarchaeobius sp. DYHT-AS-18 TaxID=3446117 RepID=UPI003EB8197B
MAQHRLKSIVPLFGGGDRYVDTLDDVLQFVDDHQPTTDELVGWHRGTFANVSSRDSIMRRVRYLQQVGFLQKTDRTWALGAAGEEYTRDYATETLLRIMCDRNVGLRSLLYALTLAPMTIAEISDQQLDTHPGLGWSRDQPDMAKQRANWLRSMGLVEKHDSEYELTDTGRRFTETAVAEWADSDWTSQSGADDQTAGTYETVVHARAIDPEFRATVLSRYDCTCPVSDVDHPGLLDVAHVLSWADYPDHRADLSNVLPLSKTHHAAFDRELFTIDSDYRLHVNPSFETQSDILQETILDREGERLSVLDGHVDSAFLRTYNASLEWL